MKIITVAGTAIALDANDIDTDQILPARYMKELTFGKLGQHAFEDNRRRAAERGEVHPFDRPERKGAKILAVAKNFGCGSSREHAPQALKRWGIAAVVGESFGEIFRGNCASIGLPCLTVTREVGTELREAVAADPGLEVRIDLETKTIAFAQKSAGFEVSEAIRSRLVAGTWDIVVELIEHAGMTAAVAGRLPYMNGFSARGGEA